jgi:L-asparaginase
MKRVLLLSTGGTISSVKGQDGTVAPALTAEDLVKTLPGIGSVATVDAREFRKVPGHYLGFQDMLELSKKIEESLSSSEYGGVVVTMGTNIIEEAAYCLDLLIRNDAPVVITGAMRNPSLPSSDAQMNLFNSIVSAASDSLRGAGCVVCMNGELHHARYVAKTNTTSISAFQSPGAGPIGVIRANKVVLQMRNARKDHIRPDTVEARVDLIRYGMSMDGSLLDASVNLGAKGIVLEAWGGGHLLPSSIPSIQGAMEKGIPVVMTSRCLSGELLENTYGFEGSETHLKRIGVIFASGLVGIKARIKLVLLLGAHKNVEQIRDAFESG